MEKQERREAYRKKLLDPRWQRRRLEILNRDEFTCQICEDETTTLHVHHRCYVKGREPWEYSDRLLVTLCASCHENETERMYPCSTALVEELKAAGLFANDFEAIAASVGTSKLVHLPEVVASVLCWVFEDAALQGELVERYLAHCNELVEKRKAATNKVDG